MPVQTLNMQSFHGILFSPEAEFSQTYSSLRQKLSEDRLNQYSSCSPEQKLKMLLELPECRFKVHPAASIKNLDRALEVKELGNEHFRNKNYGEAYKFYTKALQYCPVDQGEPLNPSNKQYSIIWANRSAALDGAGLYAACIHDIDMALRFGYPRELWYKIYKRKGHAAIKMKQYLVAKECFEICLKNVGRSDIKKEKDRDHFRTRVRKQMTVFNVTKTLYNLETYERTNSTLVNGASEDRGVSSKMEVVEGKGEGGGGAVAKEDIQPEDVLVAIEPYVSAVNVSGGRAGGKICPHTLEKMFNPVPCKFGGEELFASEEARDEASRGYHKYEWKILPNLSSVGLLERPRLALRMVTSLQPEDVARVAAMLDKKGGGEERIQTALQTFNLPVDDASGEEKLVSGVLALYLTQNLGVSGYIRAPSSTQQWTQEEQDVFNLLYRAILVSIKHTRPIELLDVPKQKLDILNQDIVRDVYAWGIYPDMDKLERSCTGEESDVIQWFLDKKLVLSSYRRIQKGAPVRLFAKPSADLPKQSQPNDMITFRCGNELCGNSFPLKENTKEKIISCPLEDCGLKTNIWERLKLIQRLKKDFASAKEELRRDEVSLARDIIRDTIEEWDRIIVRPYREVRELEAVYVKALLCSIGDQERRMVEGNQMGKIINKKAGVMAPQPEGEENTDTALVKAL